MEAEFTNPELKGGGGLLYVGGRQEQEFSMGGSGALVVSTQIHWQTQHSVLVLGCSESFCHVVRKDCSSTCNNNHITSGFTTKSLDSSAGLNAI